MLQSAQIDFYREHGYVMVPDLLDAAELAEVRREADRIVDGAQGVTTDNEVYDFEDSHQPDRPRVRRIKEPHAVSPVFARLLRHPRLLSVYSAVRLTGRAGSASVHHVRLVHGSDLNRTPRSRRLLFYEMAAADAWPLCGTTTKFTDLESFNAKIVAGTPTTLPRMRDIPIRIPLPKHDLSSIYNAQRQAGSRFFSQYAQETDGR